ncbi:HD domain-containing protein [Erwinia pyri]|uniref:5'-deoxynucleotidase n=1 Tax=Erwinia pyri TaxID=3062598 RepID=A0AA50DKN3_9GAMM|nr:HD domain-containing protein [Erwinia sp. DE2]WLS79706.1 HD domain-containing protein [Erwinia sp. DE2]
MSESVSAVDFGEMTEVIQFLMELDKLKSVERRTRLIGNSRYENSAEHSWQLAVAAMSLAPYSGSEVNVTRVVQMALLHDVVEIDAGDVMVYDLAAREAIHAQEVAAADRIFALLPAALGEKFRALWDEYEAGETADSRFANMLDRALPVIQNLHNQGQSWKENHIRLEQVISRNATIEKEWPALWHYLKQHLEQAQQRGWLM